MLIKLDYDFQFLELALGNRKYPDVANTDQVFLK